MRTIPLRVPGSGSNKRRDYELLLSKERLFFFMFHSKSKEENLPDINGSAWPLSRKNLRERKNTQLYLTWPMLIYLMARAWHSEKTSYTTAEFLNFTKSNVFYPPGRSVLIRTPRKKQILHQHHAELLGRSLNGLLKVAKIKEA